ncbi:MAG: glycoside hydrolase N-terminal domain-containing protein [Akkermansia sp.]
MKRTRTILTLLALTSLPATSLGADTKRPSSNYLWYKQPASVEKNISSNRDNFGQNESFKGNAWESQALPIGNGRIGAMVFGGDNTERLALNEISFWSGGENPGGGYGYGPEVDKNSFGSYQPFADLMIDFKADGEISNYSRSLSLEDGIARVSYTKGGVTFNREVFASYPDQVIVMNLMANKKGALNASFSLKPNHTTTITAKGNILTMSGTLKNGMAFEGQVVVIPQGGTATASSPNDAKVDVTYQNNKPILGTDNLPAINLKNANSCTVIISLATDYALSYEKNWKGESPSAKNKYCLSKTVKVPGSVLKEQHIKNYKSLFDRMKIDLGKTDPTIAQLPTDERIKSYKTNPVDPELENTMFQYGRYALISSSRPNNNALPANLQGLWNDHVHQAWACDYHNNINIQMNYWGSEPTNLSECQLPLIKYLEAMAEPCRIASQKEFKTQNGGKVRGWTVRTSQNVFGGNGWEWNIPGSAWYARHIWDHYEFTNDKNYLATVGYPMMKEISQFWEDHLKELGKDGKGFVTDDKSADLTELKGIKEGTLVAPHGWSPEHGPREDGVSMDQQLIWDLFTNTIKAANILGIDKPWATALAKKRDRLAAPKIGKEGNLQEWMIDRIAKTEHRHTSHLVSVYPCSQISMEKTPELAKAARNTLEWRGSTGDSRRSWTWPWRTALWARFHDGERAHDMVSGLIQYNMLDNMLASHPPMQMDGTFGITGGMSEMLLQSHTGEISLLPAPTKAWPDGAVKGMKARGNITVDFQWKNGKVTSYSLSSPNPKPVKIRVNGQVKTVTPKLLVAEKTKKTVKKA